MRQNFLSISFTPIVNLFNIVTFFVLAKRVLCTDSQYLACNPKSCGDGQIITFPFYIKNQQESFCGYPGFELSCNKNGQPVLQLPDNDDYIIQEIFYSNQSFRVSNAAFLDNKNSTITATTCVPQIQKNMSFPEDRLKLSPNHTELLLIYNCNSSTLANDTELSKHKIIDCVGRSETGDSGIAMLEDDPLVGYASEKCRNLVVAPVALDSYRKERNVSIGRTLENGFLLDWIASDCSFCNQSGGRCGFDSASYHFKCFCPDRPHAAGCSSGNDRRRLQIGLGLGIGVPILMAIFLLSVYVMWHCYRRKLDSSKYQSSSSYDDPSSKADLEGGSTYFGIPIFSYSELGEATNNFASEKELGDGGFGTVYYGKLRDGREVAVKRLYEHNYRRVEQFRNEIAILTRLRHKNLVSLYGCTSSRGRELLLVYEYISNGTVADHLHGDRAKSSPLTWPVRMSIAIETANALAYLHASDIIHRDVKTNNILLDSNFCVKVADFGLSRLFPNDATHVSTVPQGSPGYVDPEYHKFYHLTDKSDVYSFGVVLIELISSMPAVDISRQRDEINLSYLAISKIQMRAFDELIDPCLGYKSDESVKRMIISVAELAFRCLQQDKEMRPSMEKVLEELKKIECGEYTDIQMEQHDGSTMLKTVLPPPSPPYCDQASRLKNSQLTPSPESLTDTQNTSSCSTAASISS